MTLTTIRFVHVWKAANGNRRQIMEILHISGERIRALERELHLESPFISLREAARRAHTPPSTLHRVLKSGGLVAQQTKGGRWLITDGALNEWIEQGKPLRPFEETDWLPLREAVDRLPYNAALSTARVHCQKGWLTARKGPRGKWLVSVDALLPRHA